MVNNSDSSIEDVDDKTSFFLVLCKTRKKIDKYFKINKIRNKQIIDIRKILDEEKININNKESMAYFKILIWNKINMAKEKGKDIYYIPNFYNNDIEIEKLLFLKDSFCQEEIDFNLLLFFQEFIGTRWFEDVMSNMEHFTHSQILKDY